MENKNFLFALDKNADIMLIEDYDFNFPEGYNPQVEDVVDKEWLDKLVDDFVEEIFENIMEEIVDNEPEDMV